MKKKILTIIICTLFIATLASFQTSATNCEKESKISKIVLNSPPDIPTVEIPENVVRGHWLYIIVSTIDPDNDNVYYKFDIDGNDYGWVGPFNSGQEHTEKIIMLVPAGSYTLGVQAKDINGAESGVTYSIFNVLKSKHLSSPLINILQHHPGIIKIINKLINL